MKCSATAYTKILRTLEIARMCCRAIAAIVISFLFFPTLTVIQARHSRIVTGKNRHTLAFNTKDAEVRGKWHYKVNY